MAAPSTRFSLLIWCLLITAVLVLYIISSKTENEVSKIPETRSWKEDVRIHDNKFTQTPRQTIDNEESSSNFSYAEKLFKLYDGVETFVMFIGYPRSGHSLLGAILDAHPEIIIPHEYDVIGNWYRYQSKTLQQKNMQKHQLFSDLHLLSTEQAMFGWRASKESLIMSSKYMKQYTYNVPGLWQGGYKEKIKVIGDKKGGSTAQHIARLRSLHIFEEISEVVQVPIKFIHVTRNPFDNIATIMLRFTNSRDAVREEGEKKENKKKLDAAIRYYFKMANSNQMVRERYGDAVLDIPSHETVLRPRETLQRLCDHLGVTCYEDYLQKCIKILYATPSFTRNKVVWTEEQKERVTKIMKNYPFLKEFSFDYYPK